MEINRRTFLKGILTASVFTGSSHAWSASPPAYITTGRDRNNFFKAYILNTEGHILKKFPLPGRGHGTAINHNTSQAVVFARRPGRFAISFTPNQAGRLNTFFPPDNRHFYGHGVFSANGEFLYATENDFEEERGVIGIYDARNHYRRLGEYESGGIGPHELVLSKDKQTLIVANGGIATHPDYPRQKLNLSDMQPSITLIDIKTGVIRKRLKLPAELHQISLRHLAIDSTGDVWIGGQYQGPKADTVPLVFKLSWKDHTLKAISVPSSILSHLKQYIGSVSHNATSEFMALSAPRGNAVMIWDTRRNKLVDLIEKQDACGVAASGSRFLITSGTGNIMSATAHQQSSIQWDNHVSPLATSVTAH